MNDVYVAKKDCGHIVAAVPANSRKETADIIQRLIVSGFRIELASSWEVGKMFDLHCDCSRPPMTPIPGIFSDYPAETNGIIHDEGASAADVDALANDELADGVEDEIEAAVEEAPEVMTVSGEEPDGSDWAQEQIDVRVDVVEEVES
jgi:hypothetical protein